MVCTAGCDQRVSARARGQAHTVVGTRAGNGEARRRSVRYCFKMSAAGAKAFAWVIADDKSLDDWIRQRAHGLASLDGLTDEQALVELDRLYGEAAPFGIDDEYVPDLDLMRVVKFDSFLRRMTKQEVQDTFVGSPALYQKAIEAEPDRVEDDFVDDPRKIILPGEYSWMSPVGAVEEVDPADPFEALKSRQLEEPPFIVLEFPVDLTTAAGVRVRPPCPLDAIPGRNWQWERGDVTAEVIDRDLRREACGGVNYVDT